MADPDRIRCFVHGCRRTAPFEKFGPGVEIICGKCWKLVPGELKAKYRRFRRKRRQLERLAVKSDRPTNFPVIDRLESENWQAIRDHFSRPTKPKGLDAFLEETGL